MSDGTDEWMQQGEDPVGGEADHDEFGLVGPTLVVNIASGIQMIAGLLNLLTAGLILSTSTIYTIWMKPAPYLMGIFGVTLLLLGGAFMRARDWAAIASIGLLGMTLLLNLVWNVWALMNRGFYSWAFFALAATMLASLLAPFAVKDAIVASRNRRKLFD